jgi:hypothetical protein
VAPVRAAVGVIVVLLAFLGGVWVGLGTPGPDTGTPISGEGTLRPSEQPGPPETVETGLISYRVLGWRCGMLAVQGDHADWLADGQYCRVRLRMTSADRYVHVFTAAPQTLILGDGTQHPVNLNAMQIQDQPTRTEARPGAVLDFDLWFDVPRDTTPVGVQLFGESDDEGARVALGGQ